MSGKSYSYKFTLADDPCKASTPTQKFKTAKEAKSWKVTLLGSTDATFSVPVSWNPSDCDGTHTYTIVYGTGKAGDKAYDLYNHASKYLSYDSTTKKLKLLKTTPVSKAATGLKIYATAKNSAGYAITGDDNKLTITLDMTDPCLKAKAAFAKVADVVYTLGGAAKTFQWVKPTITPTVCVSEITFPTEYTVTIPKAISAIVTKGSVSGSNQPYTLAKTSLDTYVGTHVMTVQAKQGSTALDTKLSFNIIIKGTCDSATVTKVTPKAFTW